MICNFVIHNICQIHAMIEWTMKCGIIQNEIYCPNYNFKDTFPISLQSKCNADKQKLGWK